MIHGHCRARVQVTVLFSESASPDSAGCYLPTPDIAEAGAARITFLRVIYRSTRSQIGGPSTVSAVHAQLATMYSLSGSMRRPPFRSVMSVTRCPIGLRGSIV